MLLSQLEGILNYFGTKVRLGMVGRSTAISERCCAGDAATANSTTCC